MMSTESGLLFAKANLPDLPYSYSALEPIISSEIMELHHSRHHAGYVKNLNGAVDKLTAMAKNQDDMSGVIALEKTIHFNGGGHINHSIFWKNLCPVAESGQPEGDLKAQIVKDFGSVDLMKNQLSASTVAVQGSGWGWLGWDQQHKLIRVATCKDQDTLQVTHGLVPLFGIDVWEHAYYLDYKNARPDYVSAIWKVANWVDVAKRLEAAKAKK